MPASDPHNAHPPNLISRKVEIRNVIAEEANTGGKPLDRCK
jgi:hypothetical protein